jgi:phage host-nuclease inhibitor protein Gam
MSDTTTKTGLRLYELAPAYAYLIDALDDEGDASDGRAHLDALSDAIDAKAAGIAHVLAQLDAEAEALRAEEKRLAARRQARERRAESLREYLRMSLDAAGVPKIKTSTHTISVGDGPQRVVVEDEGAIPSEFLRTKIEVDKRAILAAMSAHGECVQGTRIERTRVLRIK